MRKIEWAPKMDWNPDPEGIITEINIPKLYEDKTKKKKKPKKISKQRLKGGR